MEGSSPSQRAGFADPVSLYSTANFSWTKLQKQATLMGRYPKLPEDKRGRSLTSRRTHLHPPTPHLALAKDCCCNHCDTTQTEISQQSWSFKELNLPTKLALGSAPTCEQALRLNLCRLFLLQHLFGVFIVSLLPPTLRWSSRRQSWAKKGW